MSMKKLWLIASILGLVGTTIVGCNDTQNGNIGTNNNTNRVINTSLENQASNSNGKLQTIGVVLNDLGNPFYVAVQNGAQKQAKKIGGGNIRVNAVSSAFDLNLQTNQIENFTAANTDLIILSAVDKKGIKPAIDQAKLAGKVVIAIDSAVDADVDAMISSNNTQAGEIGCQYIADRLQGKGNVVVLNGTPMDSINQRVSGCKNSLSKYPDIKIISDQNAEGTRDGGLRVMTDLLTTFPKIDAVFATNDQSGVGADLAARQAKRNEFFIVGVDGSPDATKAMEDKNGVFVATAAQNPAGMAEKAVEIGNDLIQGKKPESREVLIPVNLVTRENLSSYKGW